MLAPRFSSRFRRARSLAAGRPLRSVAVLVAVLGVVAAGCLPPRPDSAVNASTLAALTSGGHGADMGFSNGYPNADPSIFGRELDTSRATGAQWYRADMVDMWAADHEVPAIKARGFKLLGTLGGSNSALDPGTAAAIVRRYPSGGGGLDAVEILNEPNHRMSAAAYLGIVRAVVPQIRAADPHMPIIVGAVSPVGVMQYFNDLYAANGGGPLPGDAVSWHPYLDAYGFNPPGQWNWTRDIHNLMAAHGDGGKQIWGTETGDPTSGFHSVDPGTQAAYASQVVAQWHRFAPYAGALFWYEVRDRPWNGGLGPSDPNDWQQNFGLTYSNFTPKPAYGAFAAAIAGS